MVTCLPAIVCRSHQEHRAPNAIDPNFVHRRIGHTVQPSCDRDVDQALGNLDVAVEARAVEANDGKRTDDAGVTTIGLAPAVLDRTTVAGLLGRVSTSLHAWFQALPTGGGTGTTPVTHAVALDLPTATPYRGDMGRDSDRRCGRRIEERPARR